MYTILAEVFKGIFPLFVTVGLCSLKDLFPRQNSQVCLTIWFLGVVTLAGVLLGASFSYFGVRYLGTILTLVSLALAALGLRNIVVSMKSPNLKFYLGGLFVLAFGLPTLAVIHHQNHFNWDDYSHWLPLARHLYVTGGFVGLDNPAQNIAMPAYPPALAILSHLFHPPFASFTETTPLFLTNFFVVLLCFMVFERTTRKDNAHNVMNRFAALGIGIVLLQAILTWHQFSAYADVPLSILLLILALKLADFRAASLASIKVRDLLGATGCLVLIPLVKNYGIYLSLAMLAAWVLVAIEWRSELRIDHLHKVGTVALLLGTVTLFAHLAWSATLTLNEVSNVSRIKELSQWRWGQISDIANLMFFKVFETRYGCFLLLIFVPFLKPIKLMRANSHEAFAVKMVALFIIANVGLTFLFYIAVLSDNEVEKMLSLERYLMPSILTATVVSLLWLFRNLDKAVLRFAQKTSLAIVAISVSYTLLSSVDRITSKSHKVDHAEYDQLLKQAVSMSTKKSVAFFVNDDSRLNLPRLIYHLPNGVTGTWKLKDDLYRLNRGVNDIESFRQWVGSRDPDIFCFTGRLEMSDGQLSALNQMSEENPLKCLHVDKLAEVIGVS